MSPAFRVYGILLFCAAAPAQVLSNTSLTGKYFVRHIQFSTGSANTITDARSIIGTMTFDGAGHYSLNAQQVILTASAASFTASGTYGVDSGGIVTLSNPQSPGANINARLGTEAVIGSSTEASSNTFDLFVAIPAPDGGNNNLSANANWSAADFELTAASAASVRSSFVTMSLDGSGNIPSAAVSGHAAGVNAGLPVSQSVTGASYSITGDGSGTVAFPLPAGVTGANALLASAARILYISKSGHFLLAGTPGAHDLLIAVRGSAGAVTLSNGQRFFTAGIRFDSNGPSAGYTGSSTTVTADSSFVSTRRLHENGGNINVTAASVYSIASDGTGSAGAQKVAVEPVGTQTADMVAADNGNPLDPTAFGIDIGTAIQPLTGAGVFLNPQGIVNAASNAPAGDAISPGEFLALYGGGLAASTAVAQALPFPKSLGNVTVSINNIPAPIYFVSAGQIDCIVPYGVTGSSAAITVTSAGATSNTVTVNLAPTSPGVFSVDGSGTGDGSITHVDGSLVSASKPAVKGETVQMYVSGLGALTTPVGDGFGATAIDNATAALTVYVAGIALPSSSVTYKGLTVDAGLYQINFVVPTALTVSGELPVALQTADAFTDEVNMAVQ